MQPKFDALYRALVTSTADPTNSGRIRVQCPQISGAAEIRAAEPLNPAHPTPVVGSTVWLAFSGGDITKPTFITNNAYINLLTSGTSLSIQSPITSVSPESVLLTFNSNNGAPSYLKLLDPTGSFRSDFFMSGIMVKTNNAGTAETWHSASSLYKANWVDGTGFNGLGGPVLQYRKDVEDNVWLYGMTKSNAGAGTTVFTLPANYFNPAGASGFVAASTGSGTPTIAACAIDATGNVILTNVVTGTTYQFNFRFPLGNIA